MICAPAPSARNVLILQAVHYAIMHDLCKLPNVSRLAKGAEDTWLRLAIRQPPRAMRGASNAASCPGPQPNL